MKRQPDLRPTAPALVCLLAGVATLAGCASIENFFSGDKADYRSTTAAAKPLEVPPDLSQLARDNRYQPQGGAISASAVSQAVAAGGGGAAPAMAGAAGVKASAGDATIAPLSLGAISVQRSGTQRWLALPLPPEQVWPLVKAFWVERGFTLVSENAEAGTMETDWAENRAKIPTDFIRSSIGRVFDGLYSSNERDKFRVRIERTPGGGSEIYISHRGMEEVYIDKSKDVTTWKSRGTDPQMEAEQLSLLMVKLAPKPMAATAGTAAVAGAAPIDVARTAVANATEQPPRARAVAGGAAAALELDDSFDRAWRRVGLALDRTGFTVEDRDRTGGLYFVRYVDPKSAGKEDPGFFGKLFSRDAQASTAAVRYRVQVKGQGAVTLVSVLTSAGAPESGENGQRIIALLVNELK